MIIETTFIFWGATTTVFFPIGFFVSAFLKEFFSFGRSSVHEFFFSFDSSTSYETLLQSTHLLLFPTVVVYTCVPAAGVKCHQDH